MTDRLSKHRGFVRQLIRDMKAEGYTITRYCDEDEGWRDVEGEKALMEEIFACDEAYVGFFNPTVSEINGRKAGVAFRLIHVNDPWEEVADMGYNCEAAFEVGDRVSRRIADKYEPR